MQGCLKPPNPTQYIAHTMINYFLAEPPATAEKTGVLLINLGTPAAPTAAAVKPYLREFLSDQRVVELPRWLWQTVLRGIILPFRSGKSAHGYQKIWQSEGSPLYVYTERSAQALEQHLRKAMADAPLVAFAMTYGAPSVADTIARLKQQGVGRLLVLPLYPQYAASAGGAALDKVWRVLLQQRNQMSVRSISRYYDHPGYIQALAGKIEQHWQQHGRGDKLMLSFHGIPQAQHNAGDHYPQECRQTAVLLAQQLKLTESDYIVAFQSQFGKAKWIGPSTQDLLVSLPKNGVKKLDVICPGFAADCLETLEEIALQGREDFYAAGGTQYQYIPCLNDDSAWIDALAALVQTHLHGWG